MTTYSHDIIHINKLKILRQCSHHAAENLFQIAHTASTEIKELK